MGQLSQLKVTMLVSAIICAGSAMVMFKTADGLAEIEIPIEAARETAAIIADGLMIIRSRALPESEHLLVPTRAQRTRHIQALYERRAKPDDGIQSADVSVLPDRRREGDIISKTSDSTIVPTLDRDVLTAGTAQAASTANQNASGEHL